MRLLLDTHIALWAILDDVRLGDKVRSLIAAPANAVVVSVASILEITIKHALARGRTGDVRIPGTQALGYFRDAGYEILAIMPEHAVEVGNLPDIHNDPFDRLLVAQANVETLRLVTADRTVAAYDASIILV